MAIDNDTLRATWAEVMDEQFDAMASVEKFGGAAYRIIVDVTAENDIADYLEDLEEEGFIKLTGSDLENPYDDPDKVDTEFTVEVYNWDFIVNPVS